MQSKAATPIRLGIVGVGKIVRDQHLPTLAGSPDFGLVAAASRNARIDGVENFASIREMLDASRLDAVSLCMPPQYRYDAARSALQAGKHVFLEKPPGATVSEVEDLKKLADARGLSLFASWHSRYAPAVEAAREFLASTVIHRASIIWKEDVRRWHPDQAWIWRAGGFGVFDPGINALSIATHIFPLSLSITGASLQFPENRDAPIAARISLRGPRGMPIEAELDWRQTGPQTWDIVAETESGSMLLSGGGSRLAVDGAVVIDAPEAEYRMLYGRFAEIIRTGFSDVDLAPLQLVADAFMVGRHETVEAFQG